MTIKDNSNSLISPREAFSIVSTCVEPLANVSVNVDDALNYCLYENITSDRDIPPVNRSAMDGYAVRTSDLSEAPLELRLVGEVAAGSPEKPKVTEGACVRILTGANIPPGADAVAMVETTEDHGTEILFRTSVILGENILRQGEDAKKDETLLEKGSVLGPFQIAVCSSIGKTTVAAYKRPAVKIICTGKELRSAADDVADHEVRNTNGPALSAALRNWGFGVVDYITATDDLDKITSELHNAVRENDVVILTGGVSVGKYDFVRAAVEAVGGEIRFHGVLMKPGKPVLYATLPQNKHIFGLPGPPLSAATTFNEFALPAIRKLSGYPDDRILPTLFVPLAEDLKSKGGRPRYFLSRLEFSPDGLAACPVKSMSSADLVGGGRADGTIIVAAEDKSLAAGTIVEFRPWRPIT
ncbi:MAG: molybdopterin molybdotransferase MoeA [bacterium]|nr:molybdopterin molybdotransferase MoeA [bacterium]